MGVPIATRALFIISSEITGIVDVAAQPVRKNHSMYGDAKIVLLEFIDDLFWIGEYSRVPNERSVCRIPSGRTKTCAQVNHGVARKLFLAKCLCLLQNLVSVRESAMRLLVPEAPKRGLLRISGEPRIFRHDGFGVTGYNHKQIQWQRLSASLEFGLRVGERKGAVRLVKEKSPARNTYDPGDRYAPTMSRKFVPTLTTSHGIDGATTIKLRPTFTEA